MTKERLEEIKRSASMLIGVPWNKIVEYSMTLDNLVNNILIKAVNEALEEAAENVDLMYCVKFRNGSLETYNPGDCMYMEDGEDFVIVDKLSILNLKIKD